MFFFFPKGNIWRWLGKFNRRTVYWSINESRFSCWIYHGARYLVNTLFVWLEIYHTKLSQEIIFQEHTQKNVHSNPKPKLFKSRTNKRNNNQKNYKKNEEIEAAAWATKRVMDKIMINLYQNFKEEDIIEKIVTPEDAEFQLVNQRKNKIFSFFFSILQMFRSEVLLVVFPSLFWICFSIPLLSKPKTSLYQRK